MARSRKSAFGHLVGKTFGSLLRKYRLRARLSVRDLSAESGVDPKYIYQLEKGTSQPSLEVFFRLTTALSLDCKEIMGRMHSLVVRALREGRSRRHLA
jgi:transcriptional regulator with XRE-family HTH domain